MPCVDRMSILTCQFTHMAIRNLTYGVRCHISAIPKLLIETQIHQPTYHVQTLDIISHNQRVTHTCISFEQMASLVPFANMNTNMNFKLRPITNYRYHETYLSLYSSTSKTPLYTCLIDQQNHAKIYSLFNKSSKDFALSGTWKHKMAATKFRKLLTSSPILFGFGQFISISWGGNKELRFWHASPTVPLIRGPKWWFMSSNVYHIPTFYCSVGEKLSWFIRHLSDGLYIFHTNLWNLPSDIWAQPSEMSHMSEVFRLHWYWLHCRFCHLQFGTISRVSLNQNFENIEHDYE